MHALGEETKTCFDPTKMEDKGKAKCISSDLTQVTKVESPTRGSRAWNLDVQHHPATREAV